MDRHPILRTCPEVGVLVWRNSDQMQNVSDDQHVCLALIKLLNAGIVLEFTQMIEVNGYGSCLNQNAPSQFLGQGMAS